MATARLAKAPPQSRPTQEAMPNPGTLLPPPPPPKQLATGVQAPLNAAVGLPAKAAPTVATDQPASPPALSSRPGRRTLPYDPKGPPGQDDDDDPETWVVEPRTDNEVLRVPTVSAVGLAVAGRLEEAHAHAVAWASGKAKPQARRSKPQPVASQPQLPVAPAPLSGEPRLHHGYEDSAGWKVLWVPVGDRLELAVGASPDSDISQNAAVMLGTLLKVVRTEEDDLSESGMQMLADLGHSLDHATHVKVVEGEEPGMSAIGLGSNKKTRSRTVKLALAVRALIDSPGKLEWISDGCAVNTQMRKIYNKAYDIRRCWNGTELIRGPYAAATSSAAPPGSWMARASGPYAAATSSAAPASSWMVRASGAAAGDSETASQFPEPPEPPQGPVSQSWTLWSTPSAASASATPAAQNSWSQANQGTDPEAYDSAEIAALLEEEGQELRPFHGGSPWPFCTLCQKWSDRAHLSSPGHKAAAERAQQQRNPSTTEAGRITQSGHESQSVAQAGLTEADFEDKAHRLPKALDASLAFRRIRSDLAERSRADIRCPKADDPAAVFIRSREDDDGLEDV